MNKIKAIIQKFAALGRRAAPAMGPTALVAVAAMLLLRACPAADEAHGFQTGGGFMGPAAGAISTVTTSGGILSGSGTPANPLTTSGDISGITAGSGLTGDCTTGACTIVLGAGSGLTLGADTVIANLGTGLTFSSGAIVPNLAGGTCAAGQVVTAVSASGTATCATNAENPYAGTHLEWNDEFMFNASLVQGATTSIYQVTVSNGQVNSITGTTTRPGIAEFSTAGNAAGRAVLSTNQQSVDFGSGNWTFEWTGGFATLSATAEEYQAIVGFADVINAVNQVDGCYFLYDRGNVATSGPNSGNADKWSCWCANNSARTTFLMDGTTVSSESFTTVNQPVAALTLPNTNIYNLKVIMTGTTRAEFYVNGTKSCDISTNIPSGASRLTGATMLLVKSNGTTARTMDMDRARLAVDLTSARTTPAQ